MNLLSRLRAWLRPYPDDAEMQASMLVETRELAKLDRMEALDLAFLSFLTNPVLRQSKIADTKNHYATMRAFARGDLK